MARTLIDAGQGEIDDTIDSGISEALEDGMDQNENMAEQISNNNMIDLNKDDNLSEANKCTMYQSTEEAIRIIIDPGHGGTDTGQIIGLRMEKNENLVLALAVGNILEQYGFEVYYTRTTDVDVTIDEINELISEVNPQLYLSLHRTSNVSKNSSAGVEAIINSGNEFAFSVGNNILLQAELVGFENRGVIQVQGYSILPKELPLVTVFAGVAMTERGILNYDLMFLELVNAIVSGILISFGIQPVTTESLNVEDETNFEKSNNNFYESGLNIMINNNQNENDEINDRYEMNMNQMEEDCNCEKESFDQNQILYDEDGYDENDQLYCEDNSNTDIQAENITEYRYRVQVGLFRNFDYANNLKTQLVRQGYPAEIYRQGDFFTVQVGEFPTMDEAVELEQMLRRQGYSTLLVAV